MNAVTDADTAQAELDYLRWFYTHADFGPAHADVLGYMEERYVEERGCKVPEAYLSNEE